jgi:hypothetical protein
MATNIAADYSGIIINQNSMSSGPMSPFAWRSSYAGGWIYQTFYLPADYERGGALIPDLSGFQILVSIDTGYALAAALY